MNRKQTNRVEEDIDPGITKVVSLNLKRGTVRVKNVVHSPTNPKKDRPVRSPKTQPAVSRRGTFTQLSGAPSAEVSIRSVRPVSKASPAKPVTKPSPTSAVGSRKGQRGISVKVGKGSSPLRFPEPKSRPDAKPAAAARDTRMQKDSSKTGSTQGQIQAKQLSDEDDNDPDAIVSSESEEETEVRQPGEGGRPIPGRGEHIPSRVQSGRIEAKQVADESGPEEGRSEEEQITKKAGCDNEEKNDELPQIADARENREPLRDLEVEFHGKTELPRRGEQMRLQHPDSRRSVEGRHDETGPERKTSGEKESAASRRNDDLHLAEDVRSGGTRKSMAARAADLGVKKSVHREEEEEEKSSPVAAAHGGEDIVSKVGVIANVKGTDSVPRAPKAGGDTAMEEEKEHSSATMEKQAANIVQRSPESAVLPEADRLEAKPETKEEKRRESEAENKKHFSEVVRTAADAGEVRESQKTHRVEAKHVESGTTVGKSEGKSLQQKTDTAESNRGLMVAEPPHVAREAVDPKEAEVAPQPPQERREVPEITLPKTKPDEGATVLFQREERSPDAGLASEKQMGEHGKPETVADKVSAKISQLVEQNPDACLTVGLQTAAVRLSPADVEFVEKTLMVPESATTRADVLRAAEGKTLDANLQQDSAAEKRGEPRNAQDLNAEERKQTASENADRRAVPEGRRDSRWEAAEDVPGQVHGKEEEPPAKDSKSHTGGTEPVGHRAEGQARQDIGRSDTNRMHIEEEHKKEAEEQKTLGEIVQRRAEQEQIGQNKAESNQIAQEEKTPLGMKKTGSDFGAPDKAAAQIAGYREKQDSSGGLREANVAKERDTPRKEEASGPKEPGPGVEVASQPDEKKPEDKQPAGEAVTIPAVVAAGEEAELGNEKAGASANVVGREEPGFVATANRADSERNPSPVQQNEESKKEAVHDTGKDTSERNGSVDAKHTAKESVPVTASITSAEVTKKEEPRASADTNRAERSAEKTVIADSSPAHQNDEPKKEAMHDDTAKDTAKSDKRRMGETGIAQALEERKKPVEENLRLGTETERAATGMLQGGEAAAAEATQNFSGHVAEEIAPARREEKRKENVQGPEPTAGPNIEPQRGKSDELYRATPNRDEPTALKRETAATIQKLELRPIAAPTNEITSLSPITILPPTSHIHSPQKTAPEVSRELIVAKVRDVLKLEPGKPLTVPPPPQSQELRLAAEEVKSRARLALGASFGSAPAVPPSQKDEVSTKRKKGEHRTKGGRKLAPENVDRRQMSEDADEDDHVSSSDESKDKAVPTNRAAPSHPSNPHPEQNTFSFSNVALPPAELFTSRSGAPKKEAKPQDTPVLYDSYEDFMQSVSRQAEAAAVKSGKTAEPVLNAEIKQKAINQEKSRLESLERLRAQEVEAIKRKAKEKETLMARTKAAVRIQTAFRRCFARRRRYLQMKPAMARSPEEPAQAPQTAPAKKIDEFVEKYGPKKASSPEEQELLRKYITHCAGLIQKHFRGYKTRRGQVPRLQEWHRMAELRRAVLRGWKMRCILRCKKVVTIRSMTLDIVKSITSLQRESDQSSKNLLVTLKSQRPKKVEDLIRMINILYTTGQWTQTYPRKPRRQRIVPSFEPTIEGRPPPLPAREAAAQQPEPHRTPTVHVPEAPLPEPVAKSEHDDTRPIRPATGGELQRMVEEDRKLAGGMEIEKPAEKKPKREFLKRRTAYDPRKAAAAERHSPREKKQGPTLAEVRRRLKEEASTEKRNPQDEQIPAVEALSEPEEKGEVPGESRRSPRSYLKRKSKRVDFMKLSWGRVGRRIDCWNPQSKVAARKVSEGRRRAEASPRLATTSRRARSAAHRQIRQRDMHRVRGTPGILHVEVRMDPFKLKKLFEECHGKDHQSTRTWD